MIIDYEDDGIIRWEQNGEKKHAELIELIEAYEAGSKRGHWVWEKPSDDCRCSNCGKIVDQRYPYCPWCKTKMDEVEE